MYKSAGLPSRCRHRGRPTGDHGPRPTDFLLLHFLGALAYLAAALAAAATAALTGTASARWLALHLAFVGGVSQLVLGAAPFFAGAALAAEPPPAALVRLELAAWNLGAALVAVGYAVRVDGLVAVGGCALAAALVIFVGMLELLRRRSLQRRVAAVAWYQAGATALAGAGTLGLSAALGSPLATGDPIGAHAVAAVGGWFGGAIVGTLHTFYPSLTSTRLRWPALEAVAFGGWFAGIAAVAAGYALASRPLAAAGWCALALAAAALLANVAASAWAARRALTLPAWLVGCGQLFLAVAVASGVVTAATGIGSPHTDPWPMLPRSDAFAVLALAGWLGLTVAGSAIHLLGVLARVRALTGRGFRARPRRSRPARLATFGRGLSALAPLAIAAFAVALQAPAPAPARAGAAAGAATTAAALAFVVAASAVAAVRARPLRI